MGKDRKKSRPVETADAAAAGYAVTGADLEARRAERLSTLAILKAGRTPLQVVEIADTSEGIVTEALAAAIQREPPRRPEACTEGCAWCCHKRVGVAVPEVVRIAEYLHSFLSSPAMEALRVRIAQALEQGRQRSARPIPCPLLDGGRCLAYPVRPLTCRGFNSSDAKACQASVTDNPRAEVPVYAPQLRLTSLVLDGMRAGLAEAGLKGDLLELSAALQIVLTTPGTVQAWLEGKPVFAEARLP